MNIGGHLLENVKFMSNEIQKVESKIGWLSKMVRYWIQDAVKSHKKGTLHRQLGVPMNKRIPKVLLSHIKSADIGKTVRNPSKTGRRRVKVTGLLKKRAVLAHTLRRFK